MTHTAEIFLQRALQNTAKDKLRKDSQVNIESKNERQVFFFLALSFFEENSFTRLLINACSTGKSSVQTVIIKSCFKIIPSGIVVYITFL